MSAYPEAAFAALSKRVSDELLDRTIATLERQVGEEADLPNDHTITCWQCAALAALRELAAIRTVTDYLLSGESAERKEEANG